MANTQSYYKLNKQYINEASVELKQSIINIVFSKIITAM